jgi:hypothetical protein
LIVEMGTILGMSDVQREHPRKRSLDQVVEVFLADCRARNLSPRTLEHYDWAIRSFRRAACGQDGESCSVT